MGSVVVFQPTLLVAILLRTIFEFRTFENVYVMTGGGPGVATETISIYIYKVTQQELIWGYVAAIALAILITLSVVSALAIKKLRRGVDNNIGAER